MVSDPASWTSIHSGTPILGGKSVAQSGQGRAKVALVLEPVVIQRGTLRVITVNNGSEITNRVMDVRSYAKESSPIRLGPETRPRIA